jgi:hypothetical protein
MIRNFKVSQFQEIDFEDFEKILLGYGNLYNITCENSAFHDNSCHDEFF